MKCDPQGGARGVTRDEAAGLSPPRGARAGFTLIELIVVVFIVVLVLAFTLPAMQMTREAARQTTCRNNLKQLSLGISNHANTFDVFPSDGWGWEWIGEPDRGTGKQQPGGWIYQILPYVEQNDLHSVGSGLTPPLRRLALGDLTQLGMRMARCPSRGAADQCPRDPLLIWVNAEPRSTVSRTDYVGNGGDFFMGVSPGPDTLSEGDSPTYTWPDTGRVTGVLYLRSAIRLAGIVDGASNTYLVGEKYVAKPYYNTYGDVGYDQSIMCGDDWDVIRWTDEAPLPDGSQVFSTRFGSAHPSAFHMALCDGSVRAITYSISPMVHRQLGNRNDRAPVSGEY